jgi:hypothetical protein
MGGQWGDQQMAATRIKQERPTDVKLTPEDRKVLARFAAALKVLREVDHVDMTVPRAEVLLGVLLNPERSLHVHASALDLPTLTALRHGRAWTDMDARGNRGYDLMLAAERPFYAGSVEDEKAAAADRRTAGRLYVALNKDGAKLAERLLLALKG